MDTTNLAQVMVVLTICAATLFVLSLLGLIGYVIKRRQHRLDRFARQRELIEFAAQLVVFDVVARRMAKCILIGGMWA
jgi:hypothetical protein